MSRVEKSFGGISFAYGVDINKGPGSSVSFVQVWDNTEETQPCNEGPDGFNNILEYIEDVDADMVVRVANRYNIPILFADAYQVLD